MVDGLNPTTDRLPERWADIKTLTYEEHENPPSVSRYEDQR